MGDQDERGNPAAASNPGGKKNEPVEGLLRHDEYAKDQEHLATVWELRRQQDLKLLEMLDKSVGAIGNRLTGIEGILVEIRTELAAQKKMWEGVETFQERVLARQEEHAARIGGLEQSVAGLKAWILIVGGITGVATFLSLVLK